MAPSIQVVRKPRVAEITGLSTQTIDRMRAKGQFPDPIRLGPNSLGWTLQSVEDWISSRPPVPLQH